jgi:hypothetical protein
LQVAGAGQVTNHALTLRLGTRSAILQSPSATFASRQRGDNFPAVTIVKPQARLSAAGAERVFGEQVSSVAKRVKLAECLAFMRKGDVLAYMDLPPLSGPSCIPPTRSND